MKHKRSKAIIATFLAVVLATPGYGISTAFAESILRVSTPAAEVGETATAETVSANAQDLLAWAREQLASQDANDVDSLMAQATATDITQSWAEGTLTLTEAGIYRLSGSVETMSSLHVKAPDDGVIVIDLNGNSVTYRQPEASEADVTPEASAVVVEASKGTVVFVDSSMWRAENALDADDAEAAEAFEKSKETPKATIKTLSAADGASAVVVDERAWLTEGGSAAEMGEESAPADGVNNTGEDATSPLILSNVSLSVASDDEGQAVQDARSLIANASGVVLADGFAADGVIETGVEKALELTDGLVTGDSLVIDTKDALPGFVVAHVADGADLDKAQDVEFLTTEGYVVSLDAESRNFVLTDQKASVSALAENAKALSLLSAEGTASLANQAELAAAIADGTAVCLNDVWENVESSYAISKAGIYYLDADLETEMALLVDLSAASSGSDQSGFDTSSGDDELSGQAADQGDSGSDDATLGDVKIYLNGHTLHVEMCSQVPTGTAVDVKSAGNVLLDGAPLTDSAGSGNGSVLMEGLTVTHAVWAQECDSLEVSNLSVLAKSHRTARKLSDLNCCALEADAGTVNVHDTDITLDLSNQGSVITTSGNTSAAQGPSALKFTSDSQGGTIRDCAVTCYNSNTAAPRTLTDPEDIGWARGVTCVGAQTLTLDGVDLDVRSALGCTAGLYGKNVSVEGSGVDVSAFASQRTVAAWSTAASGITLDGPLTSTNSYEGPVEYEIGLMSAVGKTSAPFTLGAGFQTTGMSCWVGGSTASVANTSGSVVAALSGELTDARKAALAKLLTNALGEDAACAVSLSSDKSKLEFSASDAKASIQASLTKSDKVTEYEKVEDAIAAVTGTSTLTLLTDVDAIDLSKASACSSANYKLTVDLNGHSVGYINFAGISTLTITSTATDGSGNVVRGRVTGAGGAAEAAITYADYSDSKGNLTESKKSLTVSNVDIVTSGGDYYARGIYQTSMGDLTLTDVSISVSSDAPEVEGVYVDSYKTSRPRKVTLTNCDVSAVAESSGANVRGVWSKSTSLNLTLSGTDVSAEAVDGTVHGVEASGTTSIKAASSVDALSDEGSSDEAALYSSVFGTSKLSTSFSVNASSVSARVGAGADADAEAWCVSGVAGTTGAAGKLSLLGAVSLRSDTGTHINMYAEPVFVSSGAMLAPSSDQTIYVDAHGLVGGNFAYAASTSEVARVSPWFEPLAGSEYGGWDVGEGGYDSALNRYYLKFTRDDVAEDVTSGTSFKTLAEALASASDGDEVRLLGDEHVYSAVSTDKAVTLDLAGHSLAVEEGGSTASRTDDVSLGEADGRAGAISYAGDGVLSIGDSAGTGSLVVTVGSSNDTKESWYCGIASSGSGRVVLDGVKASVAYAGASATSQDVHLRGLAATGAGSSVSLVHGATLTARATAADGAFGAVDVAGVFACAGASGASVDASSSVSADNSAARDSKGDWASGTSSSSYSNLHLVEVHPQEGTEIYEEIQGKFWESASYDNAKDSGSNYDLNLYYAAPLTLDDGTLVYAFSDPVPYEQAGTRESVRASHFFMVTQYDVPMDAFAVSSSSSFTGTVTVSGSASATTTKGHAFGVYASATGTWETAEGALSGAASEETYVYSEFNKEWHFDLRNHMDLDYDGDEYDWVCYPSKNSNLYESEIRKSAQQGLAARGSFEEQTDPGALDSDPTYSYFKSPLDGDVSVTLTNLHGADGSALPDEVLSCAFDGTPAMSGQTLSDPADYAVGDVTYRFAGWSLANNSKMDGGSYLYTTEGLLDSFTLTTSIAGALTGAVTVTAVYVPVAPGQSLIRYYDEYYTVAQAVDEGAQPLFSDCGYSGGYSVPGRATSETGYTFVFEGWRAVSDGFDPCDDVLSDGESPQYETLVPLASVDACYQAIYSREVSLSTITLWGYQEDTEGVLGYNGKVFKNVDWTQGLESITEQVATVGESKEYDGQLHKMLGWSSRRTDKVPLWATDSPYADVTDEWGNRGTTFYAIYDKGVATVDCRFYVDGELWKDAPDTSKSTSLQQASGGNPELDRYTFRGWTSDPDNTIDAKTQYRAASMVGVVADAEGTDTLTLYAQFTASYYLVNYYDDDKTTWLYDLAAWPSTTIWDSNQETYTPKNDRASKFTGWVDADGNAFDQETTIVTKDMNVYATYIQESSGTGTLDNSTTGGLSKNSATLASSGGSLSASGSSGLAASSNSLESSSTASEATDASDLSTSDALASGMSNDYESSSTELAQTSGPNNTAGFVAIVALALLCLIGIIALVRWFLGRHRGEDESEAEAASSLLTPESIRF